MSYDITVEEINNLKSDDNSLFEETIHNISVRFTEAGFFDLPDKEKDKILKSISCKFNRTYLEGMTIPERLEFAEKNFCGILKSIDRVRHTIEELERERLEYFGNISLRRIVYEDKVQETREEFLEALEIYKNDKPLYLPFGKFWNDTEDNKLYFSLIKLNFESFVNCINVVLSELSYIANLLRVDHNTTLGELLELGIQTQYFTKFEEIPENPMELIANYNLIYQESKEQVNHLFVLIDKEKSNLREIIKFYCEA